ncbi:MAG: patatin-like phospholipase family protein [Bacteroidota bacterium]
MRKKYVLVLSGGGFRAAFQLGVLNFLAKHWKALTGKDTPMHFDIIAGVSAGSLNGALLAMGKLDRLNQFWQGVATEGTDMIYTSPFFKTVGDRLVMDVDSKELKDLLFRDFKIDKPFRTLLKFLVNRNEAMTDLLSSAIKSGSSNFSNLKSVADNAPLYKILLEELRTQDIKNTQYICGCVSLDDGKYHATRHTDFHNDTDFAKAVLASTSMPVVWKPVDGVNGNLKNLVDGGIRNVSPLADVIKLMNEAQEDVEYEVFIINCANGENLNVNAQDYNIAQIAFRSLYDITFAEIFSNDLEQFLQVNDLVKQAKAAGIELRHYSTKDGKRTTRKLKDFKTYIIQPPSGIDLGDSLVGSKEMINKRIKAGYTEAQRLFKKKENNLPVSVV